MKLRFLRKRKIWFIPVILLSVVVAVQLLVYCWGVFRYKQELQWLKKNNRPVSWSEFYRQYPPSPLDSPEYRELLEAMKIEPKDSYIWCLSEQRDKKSYRLSAEKHKRIVNLLNDTAAFRRRMDQPLNCPSLRWKKEPGVWSRECSAFYTLYDLEECQLGLAMSDGDSVAVVSAINNLRKCRSMDNDVYFLNEPVWSSVFPEIYALLNMGAVPDDVLVRWKREILEDNANLMKHALRLSDYRNVATIVEPVKTELGYNLKSYRWEPLPVWWRFLAPCLRAKELRRTRLDGLDMAKKVIVKKTISGGPIYKMAEGIVGGIDHVIDFGDLLHLHLFRALFQEDNYYVAKMAVWRVRLQIAYAGMAAEQYRRKYGHWPETREAMVPEFLYSVFRDPFSSEPLQYLHLPDGSCLIFNSTIDPNRFYSSSVFILCSNYLLKKAN